MDRRRKSTRVELPSDVMAKATRRREKPRERWLLTRKTWKYMADAGRRLIPDGAQNRIEDLPKIEAYFQEVCGKEPRFLLWRKSSYPGALPRPRKKKRVRGGSVRARSPSDDILPLVRPTDLFGHTSGGRLDLAKLKREFLATPSIKENVPEPEKASPAEEEERTLVDMLRKYLKVEEDEGPSRMRESDELVSALRRFLGRRSDAEGTPRRYGSREGERDLAQSSLIDSLSKYYSRSSNRDNLVQELLTDRKLLKKLYFDLRRTKSYRGGRSGGPSSGLGSRWGPLRSGDYDDRSGLRGLEYQPSRSPPPLIEVRGESVEEKTMDKGTQTLPIPEEVLQQLEREYKDRSEAATAPTSPTAPTPERKSSRRRSSVDNDDVSQSVSDTIKRYLRMARKKSVDADKADRFKRINYDKNLRNIKPKTPGDFDDDGLNKGCQTDEAWILTYREMSFSSPSGPSSPPSPQSPPSTSFFSNLLNRSSPSVSPTPTGSMQKSRSSSSVVSTLNKRLWRTARSRSTSRLAPAWAPQGSCTWADSCGRNVRLQDTTLFHLSEIERTALKQAALARLQQLNLGCSIKIPSEIGQASGTTKSKRRVYLSRRKAFTTSLFDQNRIKDSDKDSNYTRGSSFGLPLSQCVDNEKALRNRSQQHSSRTSVTSVGLDKGGYDSESGDSGEWNSGSSDTSRLQWSDDMIAITHPTECNRIPTLVTSCISYLEANGMDTVGLFRVSSSKKRVRQLREEWDRIGELALESAENPHDVATLLKEFLRDLPDPLLCRDLYQAFIQTQKIRNRHLQWESLRLIVALLPRAHRDTLRVLLSYLSRVASNSSQNKMDAANLATVLAPTLLHKANNETSGDKISDQLYEPEQVIDVMRLLIERGDDVFNVEAELLHDAYVQVAHTEPAQLDLLLQARSATMTHMPTRHDLLHAAAATGVNDEPLPPSRLRRSERTRFVRRVRDSSENISVVKIQSITKPVPLVARLSGVSTDVDGNSSTRTEVKTIHTDSPNDSGDSVSDYNEQALCGSDCENGEVDHVKNSGVIKASLHIPAAIAATSERRRLKSPPPVANLLQRDRHTSDARAAAVSRTNSTQPPTTTVLYKRGEIISSVGSSRDQR